MPFCDPPRKKKPRDSAKSSTVRWQMIAASKPNMFKKKPEPKASANIKSSERRKLLATICELYGIPQPQLTKEAELCILPLATKQASFTSPQGFSGTIFYNEHETPLWFKSRDSQVYPSLYTVWQAPYLLPRIKTHPHVIEILSDGADLMLPGTIPPFDQRAVKGAIVGVVDSHDPTVIKAVGRCKMDMTKYDYVVGKTGVAVEILHALHDGLFELNKLVDIPIPKDLSLQMPLRDNEEQTGATEETIQMPLRHNEEQNGATEETIQEHAFEGSQDNDLPLSTEPLGSLGGVAEELSTLSIDQVDNFFKRALLQSIKLDTIELPITSSQFMANHILKNLPPIAPEMCNIKKTSWKKTVKFLKAMEKNKYVVTRKKGEDVVVDAVMSRDDPEIVKFVTHKTNTAIKKPADKPSNKRDKSTEFSIINLVKPAHNSKDFFAKTFTPKPQSVLYQPQELRPLLESYFKAHDLVDKRNPKNIIIDDTLNAATKLGLGVFPRDKVLKLFVDHMSPFHIILKPGERLEDAEVSGEKNRFVRGVPPKISIITDTKIGRITVTKITNFEKFYIKPHLLAQELKVKCSGSATIAPCVQNPSLVEVTVQGPHGKRIIEILQAKGIPASSIEFVDNQKKKKKKKA